MACLILLHAQGILPSRLCNTRRLWLPLDDAVLDGRTPPSVVCFSIIVYYLVCSAAVSALYKCSLLVLLLCLVMLNPNLSPGRRSISSLECLLDLLCSRSVSLFLSLVRLWLSSMGQGSSESPSLCLLPKNSCAGELPSCQLVFRHAAMACWMFSPFSVHLVTMLFRFFTAASAKPLLSGL